MASIEIPESFDLTAHPMGVDEVGESIPWESALGLAAGWAYRAETAANWLHEYHDSAAAHRPPGINFTRAAAEGILDVSVRMATMWAAVAEVADARMTVIQTDRDDTDNAQIGDIDAPA